MPEFGLKCLHFYQQINFLKNYLAVLPAIYCCKGLHATCFQGSKIHLWYLFIKTISKLVMLCSECSDKFWVASSRNKNIQLSTPNNKAAYTGLYAYSNGFVEASQSNIFKTKTQIDTTFIFSCIFFAPMIWWIIHNILV